MPLFRTAQLVRVLRRFGPTLLGSLLLAGTAGSAAAEDCFLKVRMAGAPAAAPHRKAPVHHPAAAAGAAAAPKPSHPRPAHHPVGPRRAPRPHLAAAAAPAAVPGAKPVRQYIESSLAMASVPVYALHPTACDSHPAIQSIAPVAPVAPIAVGSTPHKLLDALAGRPGAAEAAPEADSGRPLEQGSFVPTRIRQARIAQPFGFGFGTSFPGRLKPSGLAASWEPAEASRPTRHRRLRRPSPRLLEGDAHSTARR